MPPGFRRNSAIPSVLVLHKTKLEPGEIVRESGFAMTTPIRAIIDSATSGDADPGMLRQALAEGLQRGIVTRLEIKQAKVRTDLPPWLHEILAEV